jgi:protein-serine/threonine kinase
VSAIPSRIPSPPSFSDTRTDKVTPKGYQAPIQIQLKPNQQRQTQPQPQPPPPPPGRTRRPPPSDHGGQKFNLRDLLAGNPNSARRASQRSTGSKQSGSERGASSIGETTASLSKKYGVCDRIAIGKGATSVVRLVHKWDRSEEKLYAVKVRDDCYLNHNMDIISF